MSSVQTKILQFFPEIEENREKSIFWNFVYFDGILESWASDAGAFSPDLVRCDTALEFIPCGIYAGKMNLKKRTEDCLAFIFDGISGNKTGLIVSSADLRSIEHAQKCFIGEEKLR